MRPSAFLTKRGKRCSLMSLDHENWGHESENGGDCMWGKAMIVVYDNRHDHDSHRRWCGEDGQTRGAAGKRQGQEIARMTDGVGAV